MHGYNHNSDDKAQLINDNLDIVKKIAFFYVGRVGKVVEVDDLLQLGMVGLIEAAHNYTPQDDVSFGEMVLSLNAFLCSGEKACIC